MGMMKSMRYDADVLEKAAVFSALGNAARLKILQFLNEKGRATIQELIEITNLKSPTVHQHLQKLFDARLINYTQFSNYYTVHLANEGLIIVLSELREMKPKYDESSRTENMSSFRRRYLHGID